MLPVCSLSLPLSRSISHFFTPPVIVVSLSRPNLLFPFFDSFSTPICFSLCSSTEINSCCSALLVSLRRNFSLSLFLLSFYQLRAAAAGAQEEAKKGGDGKIRRKGGTMSFWQSRKLKESLCSRETLSTSKKR